MKIIICVIERRMEPPTIVPGRGVVSSTIAPIESSTLLITNLPSDVTKRDLEGKFWGWGRMRSITIGDGFAYVEYIDPRDADDAQREVNDSILKGKRIKVEFYDDAFWKRKYQLDIWGARAREPLPLLEGETWRERYRLTTGILSNNFPISTGPNHYGVIDQNGQLHMAGKNESGQIGSGDTKTHFNPISIPLPEKAISIACGAKTTTVIIATGDVYYWGFNRDNYMALPPETLKRDWGASIVASPQLVNLPGRALRVTSGGGVIGAILEDFSVYLWGHVETRLVSPSVKIGLRAIDLAVATSRFSAMGTDGQVYFWGEDAETSGTDQWGNPRTNYIEQPTLISTPEPIKQISIGGSLIMLSVTGNVYLWKTEGLNVSGFNETAKYTSLPTKLSIPKPVSFVANKYKVFAAIAEDGSLYMWGYNGLKQISSESDRFPQFPRPVEITIGLPVNYISIGAHIVVAVTKDGAVNLWGNLRVLRDE